MHHILFYDYVEDAVRKRAPVTGEFIWSMPESKSYEKERGRVDPLAGELGDPVDGAVIVFSGTHPGAAEKSAQGDPYVKNGFARNWKVRRWATVIGGRFFLR